MNCVTCGKYLIKPAIQRNKFQTYSTFKCKDCGVGWVTKENNAYNIKVQDEGSRCDAAGNKDAEAASR